VARITFQKRQKEMKRLEKQRAKAERRAQRKLAKQSGEDSPQQEVTVSAGSESQPDPAFPHPTA
jgi:hypothetical protein